MCKWFENEEDGVIVPCGSVHHDDSNVIENMIMKLSIVPIIRHVKDDRVGMGNFLKFREEDVLALNLTSTKSSKIGEKVEKISQREAKKLCKIENIYFVENQIPPNFDLDSDICAVSSIKNGTFGILNPNLPSLHSFDEENNEENHDKATSIDISCFLKIQQQTLRG